MTELAAGAVSSLLVVIRNEALLLRGVQDDVQFIQEEMESMNSFLAHLARSVPPGGEHDEQVRTWMNQVRLLAQDCNGCIDLYLYSGNPDIHRAKGRFRRYLWWVYWSLHKLLAQHHAAVRLRQLKDRARDVGERRLRYGVEVPAKKSAGQAPSLSEPENAAAASTLEDDEQAHHSGQRAVFERRTLDDYVKEKLLEWASEIPPNAGETLSIAVVAPHADKHVLALARDTLVWDYIGYQRGILVNIPAVHLEFLPLRPKEVLYYILRQLKNDISQSQKQSIDQCDGKEEAALDPWRDYRRKCRIYHEKKRVIYKIKENIEKMKINEKLDKINSYLQDQQENGNQQQLLDLNLGQKKGVDTVQNRKDVDLVDRLGTLFQLLFMSQQDQVKNKNMHKSSLLDGGIIMKIAKKLKKYIEGDEMANKLMEQRGIKEKEKETDKQGEAEERKDEDKDGKRVGGREMGDEREEEEKGVRGERGEGERKGEKNGVGERDLVDERNEGEEKGVGGEMRDERGKEKSVGQGEIGEDERKESRENNEEKGVGGDVGDKRKRQEEGGGEARGKKEEGKAEDKEEREKNKGVGGKAEGSTTEEKEEDEGKELKEVRKEGEEQKKYNKNDEGEEEEEDDKDEDEDEDDEEEDENEDEDDDDEEEDEDDDEESLIYLDEDQYVQILREVFLKPSSSKPLQVQQQANQATITTLDEDRIKQMIHEAKQEVIRELKEDKQDNKNQTIDEPGAPDQNQDKLNEIATRIEIIEKEIKEQLKIKGIVEKIKHHLNHDCPLIILKVDEMMDGFRWEEIRKALSLLKCSADALIFTRESIQQAKGYCYPPREPIDYSLAGLNHDTVLELTRQQMDEDKYSPQVLRDILEACEPHELCMKIFTHALYVNPKRSNEELCKLRSTLRVVQPKSFNSIAKVMFKFSYNDLPKEYKSCLLYLAIFPPEYKIRRSTLIGRWVAEGLTLKEDWPSSVLHAHQCFDTLIHRCLVYPADIGDTGNVKSCIVGDLFHGFITAIARKQHIVETRLSHHLARHFSIFNNLQLRSSDRIHKFFQGLSKSSRISLLKVLDLEGCQCFGKNQRYLKDICSKMLLLKYLSLKGTDIMYLPSEINYLRDLEILDIRQTKVPEDATANILLLKLKRLLAGNIDPTSGNIATSVRVPQRIDKMVNIEILSNVKAKHRDDLKDIGKLWQLRKLGVVIEDKGSHLGNLLRTISDLHECLRSLSITFPVATPHGGTPSTVELQEDIGSCLHECLHSLSLTLPVATPQGGTPSTVELPEDIVSRLRHHPKILESLSISGTTLQGRLLPLFKRGDNNTLAKVTLSRTLLDKKDLDMLAELPRLRCVRLKHIACTEPMLTFKDGEFRCLKYLLVEGSNLTNITFEGGAAQLEKIVLSFTSTGSISGADKLPKLEEVELNSRLCGGLLSSFDEAKEIAKVTLCGTLLKQDALQILANKPSMRCLVLSDMSFDGTQNQISFNKDEFIWLNLLVVDCSTITKIVFATGSAPRLEKIIWSSPTSLSGIDNLPRLKELEFNGDLVPNEVEEFIKNNKDKLKIKHNKPETQDQAKGDEQEYDEDAGRFSLCWK